MWTKKVDTWNFNIKNIQKTQKLIVSDVHFFNNYPDPDVFTY